MTVEFYTVQKTDDGRYVFGESIVEIHSMGARKALFDCGIEIEEDGSLVGQVNFTQLNVLADYFEDNASDKETSITRGNGATMINVGHSRDRGRRKAVGFRKLAKILVENSDLIIQFS